MQDWNEKGVVIPVKDQNQCVERISKIVTDDLISLSEQELGVFSDDCKIDLDHGVVIVRYDTENSMDYWIHCNMASYPIKKGQNLPKPAPFAPSPVKPSTVCDEYYTCYARSTCYCMYALVNTVLCGATAQLNSVMVTIVATL
ncbi:hypothetical protein GOBAR_DD16251 [Gossypium barbadense]|nr:hypothetical protein GOBAR_DD16251 [Gossypium barbadense]